MEGSLELNGKDSSDLILYGSLNGQLSSDRDEYSKLDGVLSEKQNKVTGTLSIDGGINVELFAVLEESDILRGDLSNWVDSLTGTLSSSKPTNDTDDYNVLRNKPSIQGVKLIGDKSFEELGVSGSDNIVFDSGSITAIEMTEAQVAALLT